VSAPSSPTTMVGSPTRSSKPCRTTRPNPLVRRPFLHVRPASRPAWLSSHHPGRRPSGLCLTPVRSQCRILAPTPMGHSGVRLRPRGRQDWEEPVKPWKPPLSRTPAFYPPIPAVGREPSPAAAFHPARASLHCLARRGCISTSHGAMAWRDIKVDREITFTCLLQ
jgi:hypothetical protein